MAKIILLSKTLSLSTAATWEARQSLTVGAYHMSLSLTTYQGSQAVLMTGGEHDNFVVTDKVLIYKITDNKWFDMPALKLPIPLTFHSGKYDNININYLAKNNIQLFQPT